MREARVESAGIVATDVLERKDSRVMMRAVSLGLLDVDPDTHRVRPDAPLTRAAAARMMLLLASRLARPGPMPGLLPGSARARERAARRRFAWRPGANCCQNRGARSSAARSSREGLDRLRSLFPAGEAMKRD